MCGCVRAHREAFTFLAFIMVRLRACSLELDGLDPNRGSSVQEPCHLHKVLKSPWIVTGIK